MAKEIIYLNAEYHSTSKKRFLFAKRFFDAVDQKNIRYEVINGYDAVNEKVGRDVDLYLTQKADISRVIDLFKENCELTENCRFLTRKSSMWFPGGLIQLCALFEENGHHAYVAIDLIFKPFIFAGFCQYPLKNDALVETELVFFKNYLIKILAGVPLKKPVFVDNEAILKSRYYRKFLTKKKIAALLEDASLQKVPGDYKKLRRSFQLTFLLKHPFLSTKNYIISVIRKTISPFFNRIPLIVVLGPDGVGKSTILGHVFNNLASSFVTIQKVHWRPQFIPNIQSLFSRKKSNGKVESVMPRREAGKLGGIRFFYYYLDYILGHFFLTQYSKFSEMPLIVYDRFLYDFYIDPIRFGIKKIDKLLFFIKIFPRPDKIFVLKDKPENIAARKSELSEAEIREQYSKFEKLQDMNLVDKVYDLGEKTFEEVEIELKDDILTLLEKKYSSPEKYVQN